MFIDIDSEISLIIVLDDRQWVWIFVAYSIVHFIYVARFAVYRLCWLTIIEHVACCWQWVLLHSECFNWKKWRKKFWDPSTNKRNLFMLQISRLAISCSVRVCNCWEIIANFSVKNRPYLILLKQHDFPAKWFFVIKLKISNYTNIWAQEVQYFAAVKMKFHFHVLLPMRQCLEVFAKHNILG